MKGDFVNETLYSEGSASSGFLTDTNERFVDLFTDIISENRSKLTIIPRYKNETQGSIIYFRLVDSLSRKVVSEVKSTSEETIVELVPKIVVGRKFDLQYKTSSDDNEISMSMINHQYKI